MQNFPIWVSELGTEDLWSKAILDIYLTKVSFFSGLPHIWQRSTSLAFASDLVLAILLALESVDGIFPELFYKKVRRFLFIILCEACGNRDRFF